MSPGTDDPNTTAYPGQVDGNGCIFPAGAQTIANQLDAAYPPNPTTNVASWREYAEDMGNDPTRDGGTADPLGGTDCAHPTVGGTDKAVTAEATDQYATRHNPFMYFHSIIDNTAECDANVVPLGTVAAGTPSTFNGTQLPDTFTGHLANDLSSEATTPRFGFITPNLCDDGHDDTCAGTNLEGGKTGGLAGADIWLQHYMPLIMASPSYQSGQMLVVITSDEGALTDTTACCNEQPGPNWAYPGFSPLLGTAPTTPGRRPRRWEDRGPPAQLQIHPARDGRHDGLLQPLFGAAELRGSAGTHQWGHGRLRPPRFRRRTRADALRPGHLPAR